MSIRIPIVINNVPMETTCPRCQGTGNDPNQKPGLMARLAGIEEWCSECYSEGVVLNENGAKMMQLIVSHLSTTAGRLRLRGSD
jgi:DnaJ-class molecular chaperone